MKHSSSPISCARQVRPARRRLLPLHLSKNMKKDSTYFMTRKRCIACIFCIIGVIAAILFFMERDNDTFKNLRTIPVTSTQMVLAKIIVLFLFGIVFCVASTIVTILCGFGTLEVYGTGYKLFLAVETGIFITAGTLPLIVLVVFFSKTYVFSILLCVFYSVLNMSATALFDTLPKTMLWLLPTPLTTFWSAGDMAAHGIKMELEHMTGLIPVSYTHLDV